MHHEIEVFQTRDTTLIDPTIKALWPMVSYDGCGCLESVGNAVNDPDFIFIEIRVDKHYGGLFMLIKNEVHTLLLDNVRGLLAIRVGKTAIRWTAQNTTLKFLTSFALFQQA